MMVHEVRDDQSMLSESRNGNRNNNMRKALRSQMEQEWGKEQGMFAS